MGIKYVLLQALLMVYTILCHICSLFVIDVQNDFRLYLYTMKTEAGPEVIKLFPCSIQLSTKYILLINVKMPTIVGILTFISMITTTSERLKAINFFICR